MNKKIFLLNFGVFLTLVVALITTGCASSKTYKKINPLALKLSVGAGEIIDREFTKYRPIVIDGANFTPSQNVKILIENFPNQPPQITTGDTANAQGVFHKQWNFYLVGQSFANPGAKIKVTAIDLIAGKTVSQTISASLFIAQ